MQKPQIVNNEQVKGGEPGDGWHKSLSGGRPATSSRDNPVAGQWGWVAHINTNKQVEHHQEL